MYQDILFTLTPPKRGGSVQGVSKSDNDLVKTCTLEDVRSLGMVSDCAAFRCRTHHGATYLIYVLPPEAAFDRSHRRRFDTLCSHNRNPVYICPDPNCPNYGRTIPRRHSDATVRHLQKVLILLAILSILLGTQETLASQLWELFLSVFKVLLQP